MYDLTNTLITSRLQNVYDRMHEATQRAGRDPTSVKLIAVSKMQPAEYIVAAFIAGQRAFGENYVQEALAKQQTVIELMPDTKDIDWHFLGHIQKNKAKDVAGRFLLIHTLDSIEFANLLSQRLPDNIPHQSVLIQINIGEEPQKKGITEDALMPLLENLVKIPRIQVQGFMCLPPYFNGGEEVRPYFVRMRTLLENMRQETGLALPVLSMGMSGDFPIAIEEGATLIRVGSDIFGERPAR